MNTTIRSALCALALIVPAWMVLRAAEAVPGQNTGRVLVLANERTLEGDIERQGDQYRLKRSVGEAWIPSENVLCLCATRDEAYLFLRSRANLRDPDEHLRLASWCHHHGLRQQALDEVSAAVALRPNHAESRRLLRSLQRTNETAPVTSVAPTHDEQETTQNLPAVDTQSLSLFLARVQPILMNACASCHATGRGGSFKLIRAFENGAGSRKTTQQNLLAVLAQVARDHPQASPLLTKAVSVHGDMAQPALKSKEVPAYRALEEWVRLTLESNPQLRESPVVSLIPVVPMERAAATEPAPVKRAAIAVEASASGQATTVSSPPKRGTVNEVGNSPRPAGRPGPVDPFDPVIFNRQMHPERKN